MGIARPGLSPLQILAFWADAQILEEGSVVTWGQTHMGGDSSEVQEQLRRTSFAVWPGLQSFQVLPQITMVESLRVVNTAVA